MGVGCALCRKEMPRKQSHGWVAPFDYLERLGIAMLSLTVSALPPLPFCPRGTSGHREGHVSCSGVQEARTRWVVAGVGCRNACRHCLGLVPYIALLLSPRPPCPPSIFQHCYAPPSPFHLPTLLCSPVPLSSSNIAMLLTPRPPSPIHLPTLRCVEAPSPSPLPPPTVPNFDLRPSLLCVDVAALYCRPYAPLPSLTHSRCHA